MRLPDPARSNAVLIGTGTHQSLALRDVPAVRRNLTDLTAALGDPVFGSIPAGRQTMVPDPADARTACRALRNAADAAVDTLLVYFAGHGLLGAKGELFLAMADTDPEELRVSALEYDVLREVMSECGADNRIVVLDCCFSGRAVPVLGTPLTQTAIEGTYVIASAPPNGVALAPDGSTYTAFTGELITLLRDGVPGGPELLGLGEIHRRLLRAAVRRGIPRPVCSGTGTADLLALARNAALGLAVSEDTLGASDTLAQAPVDTAVTTSSGPDCARRSRRRTLVSMAAVAAAGGGIGLTAWKVLDREKDRADDPSSAHSPSTGRGGAPTTVSPAPSSTAPGGSDEDATVGSGGTTAKEDISGWKAVADTADVPVGGGLIVDEQRVTIIQPEEGDFRAFSAFCPHRGCMVTSISDSAIHCPCHGSSFDLADGSVLGGPAARGLIPKPLRIRQGRIEIPADE